MLTLHYQKDKETPEALKPVLFFYICIVIANVKN